MFKLSNRWLNARLRADPSQTSRKTSLGLGVVFAVGALSASLHGAAAAGPIVTTKEGPVQGFISIIETGISWKTAPHRHLYAPSLVNRFMNQRTIRSGSYVQAFQSMAKGALTR
jgi:hypothetical protein